MDYKREAILELIGDAEFLKRKYGEADEILDSILSDVILKLKELLKN